MSVELTSAVFASDIVEFKENNDKNSIIQLVKHRYDERFINPFRDNSQKHGFAMMAVCCLMVESLISMKRGINETSDARNEQGHKIYSGELFEEFFSESSYFCGFSGLGRDFYKHIRCGILHQAETTGGWRIRRKGELVDKNEKIINATKFMNALESELNAYLHKLEIEDFTDLVWVNLLKKIDFIASNAVG
ncbi:hypothetical protein RVU00_003530, partial [Vibrio cholerae]|nr:hypothetical protein [Vibrio cholerae]